MNGPRIGLFTFYTGNFGAMHIPKMDSSLSELTITQADSDRIGIFKVWLSVMVVFIHSYSENVNFTGECVSFDVPVWLDVLKYTISQVISRSAVPAFFFLSSYFLYRKSFSYKQNIVKKIKSLLVPYFILNSFWVFFFYVAQCMPFTNVFFSRSEDIVAEWSVSHWICCFIGSPSKKPLLYPLWFIRDLFVLNLLSTVFDSVVGKIKHISLLVLVLVWLFLDSTHVFFLNVQALCFWGIGCYFAKHRIQLSSFDKYKALLYTIYPCLIVISCQLRDTSVAGKLLVIRLCILFGLPFWYVCTEIVKHNRIKRLTHFISRYSFCIYLFHEMNLTILRKILARIIPTSPFFSLFLYLGVPAIIITYCVVLSSMLEKYTPKFYMVISGGRIR